MKEKIEKRLDIAINNIENDNFEESFPLILEDLEYMLEGYEKDMEKLSDVEAFKHGTSLRQKKILYFSKLSKLYFKIMYQMDINIINSNDYSLSIAGGGYNEKDGNIYYSDFGVLLTKRSELTFLHTCLHEGRHKMQHKFYQTADLLSFPPYMLKLLKESLLESSYKENNREFYITNYDILFTENDAELFAKKEIYNFIINLTHIYISKYNKSEIDINKLLNKISKINNLFDSILVNEHFKIHDKTINQIYNNSQINSSYTVSKEPADRLIVMDKYIKSHPELQEKYPILRLLFNGNNPKSYEELMADKIILKEGKNINEQRQIDNLYNEIIILDPILALTDMLEKKDIQAVENYLDTHPTVITEYQDEIKRLFKKYGNFKTITK